MLCLANKKEIRLAKTIYYTAVSLDGFIAGPNNAMDWLHTKRANNDHPFKYESFINRVGALCMGAATYRWIVDHHEGANREWIYDQPSWVFTHHPPTGETDPKLKITQAQVAEVHTKMRQAAVDKDIWIVGGGDLAGQFYDVGLLDEIIVNVAACTLGGGSPLLPRRAELELKQVFHDLDFIVAQYLVK